MQRLDNPIPIWLDQRGELLDAGFIYAGVANGDPEASPITVYWDSALTQAAAQPLRTRGGAIVNDSGSPALVFIGEADYSMRVRDADGDLVSYVASGSDAGGASYQPLDSDLSAIAELSTTAFGRSLLTAASATGLRALAEIVDSIPKAGGTVTGNIVRNGAGPHLYHMTSGFVAGRVFATVNTGADPTSENGDIWLKYAP